MCVIVYNTKTKVEAESPAELKKMLNVKTLPLYEGYSSVNEDDLENCCLCPVDVKTAVEELGWQYHEIDEDFMNVEITPKL